MDGHPSSTPRQGKISLLNRLASKTSGAKAHRAESYSGGISATKTGATETTSKTGAGSSAPGPVTAHRSTSAKSPGAKLAAPNLSSEQRKHSVPEVKSPKRLQPQTSSTGNVEGGNGDEPGKEQATPPQQQRRPKLKFLDGLKNPLKLLPTKQK